MTIQDRLTQTLTLKTELDSIIYRPPIEADSGYEKRLIIAGYGLYSIIKARQAYFSSAVSYRDFNVGCATVGFDRSTNRIGLFTGANVKVDSTDLVNIHAEDIALNKADSNGFNSISLLSIVGLPQVDHFSQHQDVTLHPCGKCRYKMAESPAITADTLFMSATPSLNDIEIYDLETLISHHSDQNSNGLAHFKLEDDAANWDEVVAPYLVTRHC